ncbi:site-specific integrase [Stenotrophomonas maltophilia]|uniref:site-specific integrase n=1 Tax=Stenotrophomonas maltophilia TaxID=40324 RepID=UPI000DB53D3D|nr:integrase [Stenotrophomonas maltophilia]
MPKPLLLKRASGLYARFLVPVDLRPMLGCRFLVRALPGRGDDARLVAARMAVALSEAFQAIRTGTMNDDIKEILRRVRENGHKELTIQQVTLPNGLTLGGVEINTAEDRRLFRQTVQDLNALAGKDPLMAAMQGWEPPQPPAPSAPPSGPLLSDRIEVYLNDMRRAQRAVRNVMDTEYTLRLFLALGDDRPIEQISATDVRAFLDALAAYPASASKKAEFRGLTPKEVLAKAKMRSYPTLRERTQEKRRDHLAAFFNAQADEALIPKAPHKAIMNRAKSKTDEPTREPFTPEELAKLFDAEAFPAWASKYPHRWWGSILGVATGARVNEVAQLYVGDVAEVGGHWGIHIRVSHKDQRLKNRHSSRFVPLSDTVLQAGFLAFVEDVKRAGFHRLFPHLPYSEGGGYGDAMGDQFRAYAIKRGLTDRLKSYHCFRHNVSNTMVNDIGTTIQMAQEITGHDLTLPSGLKHYVNPGTIPARLEALNKYGPPVQIPAYVPGQFNHAFKQVRHMERRRKRAADNRVKKAT